MNKKVNFIITIAVLCLISIICLASYFLSYERITVYQCTFTGAYKSEYLNYFGQLKKIEVLKEDNFYWELKKRNIEFQSNWTKYYELEQSIFNKILNLSVKKNLFDTAAILKREDLFRLDVNWSKFKNSELITVYKGLKVNSDIEELNSIEIILQHAKVDHDGQLLTK